MGAGARIGWAGLLGWLLLAVPAGAADTNMDVHVGWGERARQGGWIPVTVQVSDVKPRNAVIEIVAPHDSAMGMKISQPVGIGPSPQTYVLYAPLVNMWGEPTMVRVRDAGTNKVLAEQAILDRDNMDVQAGVKSANAFYDASKTFIGLSGRGKALGESENPNSGPMLGYVTEPFLPRVAKGYTGLDFLVLNQPDLAAMEIAQQSSICDWVRSGGKLILWLSEDQVPVGSPLAHLLPCKVGEVIVVQPTQQELQSAWLPQRFGKIKGRALTANEGSRDHTAEGDGDGDGDFV